MPTASFRCFLLATWIRANAAAGQPEHQNRVEPRREDAGSGVAGSEPREFAGDDVAGRESG